jgi:hypothetical protein
MKLTLCVEEVSMKVEILCGIDVVVVAVASTVKATVLVYEVDVLVLVKVNVLVDV